MEIKNFLKNYDIISPDWKKAPVGYPFCKTTMLSEKEKIIWEAAKIAWINEHPVDYLGQIVANGTVTSIALVAISTVVISLLYYMNINYHLGLNFLTNFFA